MSHVKQQNRPKILQTSVIYQIYQQSVLVIKFYNFIHLKNLANDKDNMHTCLPTFSWNAAYKIKKEDAINNQNTITIRKSLDKQIVTHHDID